MKKSLLSFFIALAGFAMLFIFQNCGVQKPQVENAEFMSTSFTHTGAEVSCAQCHTRPADKSNFTSVNAYAPYDYTNHGAKLDCVSCHSSMPNVNRTANDWTNGYYQHPSTIKTCNECHTSQRPNTLISGSAHPTTGECLSCHASSLTLVQDKPVSFYSSMDVGTMWKTSSTKPTFLTNDPATDVAAAVFSAVYNSGASFTGWSTGSPYAQMLKMQMNHQAVVVGVDMNACFTCHANANDYSKARFHSSVLSQPTSCSSCHDDANASNTPKPFVVGKEDAFVGPSNLVNAATNPSLFNHNVSAATADCNSCHAQSNWSSATWKNGIFHKANNTAPATCVECHNPSRPVGVTAGGFDHATMNGMGECAICHNGALAAVKTKTAVSNTASLKLSSADWKGAASTPAGMAGTKNLAVAAIKYNSNAGVIISKTASTQNFLLQIDHSAYQTNCTQCHGSSTDMKMGIFHAAMSTQPTSCKSCHTSALGSFVLGYPLSKPIDHNHATVLAKDCVSCHNSPNSANKGINFKDGVYHSKLSAAPTTCKECHSAKILDQPIWGVKDHSTVGAVDCLGCHTATGTGGTVQAPNWKGATGAPSGITGTKAITVAAVKFNFTTGGIISKTASNQNFTLQIDHAPYQTNCTQCHASSDAKLGTFHSTMTTQPTTCKNCHISALGGFVLGYAMAKPTDHTSTMVAAKDCNICHATPTAANKGINFKDGVLHAKLSAAPATCKECHAGKILDQPLWGTKDHSTIGTADCLGCHTATGTNGTVQAPNWKGGKGTPSTYTIESHTTTVSVAGFSASHTQTITNCASCHGTSTTYKTITSFDHQGLPAGNDTCLSCHFGTKAQVAGYIDLGSRILMKSNDSRHHKSTIFTNQGVSCVGCHTLSVGSGTFSTRNGIVFPTSAKQAYVNIGCGSVNASTFSCHEGGQRTMVIPVTPAGTAGKWK